VGKGVGCGDGTGVGCGVGTGVGKRDGISVGIAEGKGVGGALGSDVGRSVGTGAGAWVGFNVSDGAWVLVGATVGWAVVGVADGRRDAVSLVGLEVGAKEGEGVGRSVGEKSWSGHTMFSMWLNTDSLQVSAQSSSLRHKRGKREKQLVSCQSDRSQRRKRGKFKTDHLKRAFIGEAGYQYYQKFTQEALHVAKHGSFDGQARFDGPAVGL